eukprot:122159_1
MASSRLHCLKQYNLLYRSYPLLSPYTHRCGSLIPSSTKCILPQQKRLFAENKSREDALKDSFISKYQKKIQKAQTHEAWTRYETEMKPFTEYPDQEGKESAKQEGAEGDEMPKEARYNPTTVIGIPRATFRGLFIGISCFIGATLFVILKPAPISEEKERENMTYFARLNADPEVHVTYSGLMYKIIEQHELNPDETDINLLTNPNPDIHCVNIDYEGRFMDGEVFDSTFTSGAQEGGCTYPAKSLISGLHQGLTNMTRESVFEFYLPPHLGYGERGSEFIPPHEALVFRVKLNDFWKDQDLNRPRKFKFVN